MDVVDDGVAEVGRKLQVEHFTADVASDTPDAQPAEAGVDVRGVGA